MVKRTALLFFVTISIFLSAGCISVKEKVTTPKLLKTEISDSKTLMTEVNRFARVASMRAKMDLKFEDNSFAESGIAEKYKSADGEVVVQRPGYILLKVQAPFIKTDIAQMASNGKRFCIAILQDGGDGRYKKFVCGTNDADYSVLQERVMTADLDKGKVLKQNVNAFANLRPQHFTDALLVRPIDTQAFSYTTSTITQEEIDFELLKKKSPLAWVLHGYYLLDELTKNGDGTLRTVRRFWFDRVGGIRLARQQIFDERGEIDSDIVYGQEGNLGAAGDYKNLPLQISVTRPKEKYKMRLTYQTPENVSIGKSYPLDAFELKNQWGLEVVELDDKLKESVKKTPAPEIPRAAAPFQ